ncbi:MAG: cobalamin-dependent protein [Acidobacteriia bacterium]|nr:cobalamin-dependent protein [Terriglobia bacterium]
MEPHPKGTKARILLSGVFGPYARDDEFGSRTINPMELFQNQVTRAQGAFSLRMFHRSWGIMMIQENISAPCTVLDFPTRERFAEELKREQYDVVGISSIIMNVWKVREMCRMVRELSPGTTILVGGHVAAIPGLERMIDADHIVKGEGIAWMREYLGEDPRAPIRHPHIVSAFGVRVMGLPDRPRPGRTAATFIPSVGCPMGCNFCTTSAFFGGKGKSVDFYETGDELFHVLCEIESALHVQSFFVMDENFLLNRTRALELLRRMKEHGKAWVFYVFSSANAIRKYSMQELVELGVSWIWLGLESPRSGYSKLNGTDTMALARELHAHGIKVLGSTIVGMEHHTPENIRDEIEYAVSHDTDFHQFMLYTPIPGTPLHQQMKEEGRLLEDMDPADIHGQFKFNFRHASISRDDSKRFLDWAFLRDFERNGPSLFRVCKTMLEGWKRYKDHPDARVRRRFEWEVRDLKATYAWLLWAMEKRLKKSNRSVSEQIHSLRRDLSKEFGVLRTRFLAAVIGPILLWAHKREEKRLAAGVTYEPPTIIERRNWAST